MQLHELQWMESSNRIWEAAPHPHVRIWKADIVCAWATTGSYFVAESSIALDTTIPWLELASLHGYGIWVEQWRDVEPIAAQALIHHVISKYRTEPADAAA